MEDAAYSRMLRKYYADEKPLPADVKFVQRLVGARTTAEKKAVTDMLKEFFYLENDGWHNKRCDVELAISGELELEREAKTANERERQRRHREERTKLFEELRNLDIVPAYDTKTEMLRSLLCHTPVTRDISVISHDVTQPVTCTATANQTPVTSTQLPDTSYQYNPLTLPDGSVTPNISLETKPLKSKTLLIKTTEGESAIQASCRAVWESYSHAYNGRYGATPVRNAKVNGQIRLFVGRIGRDEAPLVVAFFVQHNAQYYVKKMHDMGTLLADAEKIRTEWATNHRVTETAARQADKRQAIGDVFGPLIEEARKREENANN